MILKYEIVFADSRQKLSDEVVKRLSAGYTLLGAPFVSEHLGGVTQFNQAMVSHGV